MSSINKRQIFRGSASNLLRVVLSMLVSLVLPPFLVHRLSPAEYAAWVLILQLSSYVNFLDLGLSTAIGKFVAEYDAVGNKEASRKLVSTAFIVLCAASAIAAVAICILAQQVPHVFHQMPLTLVPKVRLSLLAVGLSTSLALPLSVFISIFNGLQRYGFPTVLYTTSRVGSAIVLVVIVFLHGSLVEMAVTIAIFNVITALFQVYGWHHLLRDRIDFVLFHFDAPTGRRLVEYCGVLSLWTLGNIFISGLDTTIVAHYDFHNTGYYAVASSATNFMLLLVGSLMAPLLPAMSASQTQRDATQLGRMVIKATRYGALLLCVLGLPLFFGSYPLLAAWVGKSYAAHSALFLRLLVVGNVLRQLAAPYSLTIVAVGKQRLATASPIAEAIVNLAASIFLARHYGAAGVAMGTVVGALAGVIVHLVVSMSLTQSISRIQRSRFLLQGVLRPFACLAPFLALLPLWRRSAILPFQPGWLLLAASLSVTIAWLLGLDAQDRASARTTLFRLP